MVSLDFDSHSKARTRSLHDRRWMSEAWEDRWDKLRGDRNHDILGEGDEVGKPPKAQRLDVLV